MTIEALDRNASYVVDQWIWKELEARLEGSGPEIQNLKSKIQNREACWLWDCKQEREAQLLQLREWLGNRPAGPVIVCSTGWALHEYAGELAVISDHYSLADPFLYISRDQAGKVEFLGLSEPYTRRYIDWATNLAAEHGAGLLQARAVNTPTPWLLSPAERELLVQFGAEFATSYLSFVVKFARELERPRLGLLVIRRGGEKPPLSEAAIKFLAGLLA